jgi:anti-anti-sigma factor
MEILPDAAIRDLGLSGHVCWLVSDPRTYDELAAALLAEGGGLGQRPVAFGPGAVNPGTPAAIMDLIRELAAKAPADGYGGLRIVADMDCILPLHLSTADIVAFELQLDRLLSELNATVVCAYRRSSFDTTAIAGALAVHPEQLGSGPRAPFRFVAGAQQRWRLSGEVDMSMREAFAAACGTAATLGDCVIDVTDLRFIDISGMRAIAHGAQAAGDAILLHGASADLRRLWDVSGFKDFAPEVQFSSLPEPTRKRNQRQKPPHSPSRLPGSPGRKHTQARPGPGNRAAEPVSRITRGTRPIQVSGRPRSGTHS